ncbi:MAG: metallophosphoesterase [Propionibacteriaceae bacterium]|nr:metallophosphoesterase [Propionibacteriaceae bacterium]
MSLTTTLLIAGILLWCYLFIALGVLTKLKLGWAILTGAILALAVAGSLGSILFTSTLGSTPYRLPLMVASLGVTEMVYLSAALVVVYLVGVPWWIIHLTRKKLLRNKTASPARAVEETPLAPVYVLVVRFLAVIMIAVSLFISAYGFIKAQRPAITEVTLSYKELPRSFNGMKIALVSDLHIGAATRSSFLEMVVSQVNAQQADVIIIAGDSVDGFVKDLGEEMTPLGELFAPYGVVMATGNHDTHLDPWGWIDYFSAQGITVLTNEALFLHKGHDHIEILGIPDRYGYDDLGPNLPATLEHAQSGRNDETPGFRILVAHQPNQLFDNDSLASRSGISLQLSGHTHGGQLWPTGYYTMANQPALDGVHEFDGVTLVTSRGIGNWLTPARIGADPEIIVITLTRDEPTYTPDPSGNVGG